MEAVRCIYCSAPADSLEHPLPAALGEFKDAPLLEGRICKACNNQRLGLLDQQLTRSGPEALLRRFYGIEGRGTHRHVNVFERRSAGGQPIDLRSMDRELGVEVALEIENGQARQMRQVIFVEESGKVHHLRIRKDSTPDQLRAEFKGLGAVQPFKDVRFFFSPEERDWLESLIKETWPTVTFGDVKQGSTSYQGAVGTVELTNRYFRAIAKIGFHYFLTQFPEYTGHEEMFADIRQFILDEAAGVDRANAFIGKRENALLGAMLTPGVRPNGWKGHVLCAETRPGVGIAYSQTFVSEDWPAPIYAVHVARDASITECRAVGHAYMYHGNGPEGRFAGDALALETTRANWEPPPFTPVVKSA